MIKRFDIRIIELIDRCTTAMQRRGMLPLNTLIMGTECLFWSVVAVGVPWWWMPLVVLSLCSGYAKWRNAHGYWENHRKAQELNAWVLLARDRWDNRAAVNMLVVLTAPLFWDNLRHVISGVTLVGMMYLRCCRYLGPGDFARERRVSMSGAFESTQA